VAHFVLVFQNSNKPLEGQNLANENTTNYSIKSIIWNQLGLDLDFNYILKIGTRYIVGIV
jgi:hypothetical protein